MKRWSTTDSVVSTTELRRAAMDLLARREHTRNELIDKLLARVRRSAERQRLAARRRDRQAGAAVGSLAEAEAALLAETIESAAGDGRDGESDPVLQPSVTDDASATVDLDTLRAMITAVVDQLQNEGLQDDNRFIESFIASRAARLYGPLRIRQELRQRGIGAELIETMLADAGIDWREQQQQLIEQKFGRRPAPDFKERARRLRFLQYRGFDTRDADI